MGGRPRSTRSSLTTVKTCSGTGSAASADSETFMPPKPSWPRAESMEASQSVLFGAMLAGGLDGGRIPAAPAGALVSPAAMELMIMMPIGSNNVATRRREQ